MRIEAYNKTAALLLAQQIFNCTDRDITITTIKSPYKKLWGLVKRKGYYDIRQNQVNDIGNAINNKKVHDGYVEIKEGLFTIKNPMRNGRYPSIITEDPNIEVLINNKKVNGVCVICETDDIKVAAKTIEPKVNMAVSFSDSMLTASLTIYAETGKEYYVKDTERNVSIKIKSGYKKTYPSKPSLGECLKMLMDKGIKAEFIKIDSIEKLLSLQNGGTAVVAKGIAPIEGTPTSLKYYFKRFNSRKEFLEMENCSADFDEELKPVVQIGDVLAEKFFSAIQGEAGISVMGETIKAAIIEDKELRAGSGAILIDNGRKVVSTIGGRHFMDKGKISVMPLLVISQNIDRDHGDIEFDGDIVIKGDVLDNIKIKAYGDIKIYGSVYYSKITSSRNICIHGNVVNSQVIAGINIISYFCVIPKLEQMEKVIKSYLKYIDNRDKIDTPYTYKTSLLSLVISETKVLNRYIKEIEELYKILQEDDVNVLKDIVEKIKHALTGFGAQCLNDTNLIKLIHSEVLDYIDNTKNLYTESTNIIVKNASNSTLQACGNVTVTGEGSYQTNIFAKSAIYLRNSYSYVRGGILIAGRYIKAGVVGSQAGIHTYCRIINKNGKIRALLLSGTIINIDNNIKLVSKDYYSNSKADQMVKGD